MRTNRKNANIVYNGLDVNCNITSKDPFDQVYYAGSNTFIPNRTLTPLVLIPSLEVIDIAGQKIGTAFTKVSWYFGEIKQENLITSRVNTDDFYLSGLNLIVKKNLSNPIQISFLGEFLDKRTNKPIQVPKVIELSVLNTSEIAPAPTIGIDRPSDWSHNPIKDNPIQTLTASVFVNEKSHQSAVKWLVEHNGVKEPIDLYDCYIEGQDSDKLTINVDKLPSGALIHVEHLSEDVYNRFYGINPEWDNRMQEVMDNRNLLIERKCEKGYFAPNDIVAGSIGYMYTDYFISVKDSNVTLTRGVSNVSDGSYWRLNYYNKEKEYISRMAIPEEDVTLDFIKDKNVAFIKASFPSDTWAKAEIGDKATPYTPAPEDLNYRNLVVNGDFSDGTKGWSSVGSGITFTDRSVILGGEGSSWVRHEVSNKPNTGDRLYVKFQYKNNGADGDLRTGGGAIDLVTGSMLGGNTSLSNVLDVLSDGTTATRNYISMYLRNNTKGYYEVVGVITINLTEKFGAGNEPSKEVCDEIFADYGYIPAPEDLAPDGIIKGQYTANVPFFVKYPSLDVDIQDFGEIPEDVTEQTFNALVSYNKGILDNPSKYLDLEFILGDNKAGGKEEPIGKGNAVTIATTRLHGNKYVVLDWNFKPRPQTLTKM